MYFIAEKIVPSIMNKDGFGFVVICPQPNFALTRVTSQNLHQHFPQCPVSFVVPPKGDNVEKQRINKLGHVVEGGKTITSLINEGLGGSKKKWNFVLIGGGMISVNLVKKYFWFCRTDKDILFPVVDRKVYFDEGSINGLLMNNNVLNEVGPIPETENLGLAKLEWCSKAIEKGYTFKGIVGAKFM